MKKVKKIPLRKCIVTGERFEKRELIRVVKTPEGNVIVDPTGKANGRGAYVSKNTEVVLKAKKTKILERVLETEISDEIYTTLLGLVNHE